MFGEILSVVTALLWAISTILSAEALKNIEPLSVNALKSLFSSFSMLPVIFLMGEVNNIPNLDFYGLFFIVLAVIIGFGAGDTCLFRSITLVGVSRSYTIAYTFPFFTMILATIFLGEPFLFRYLVGTAMIFFGIILVLVGGKSQDTKKSSEGLLTAFAAAVFWSLGLILVPLGLKKISVILANAFRFPFLFVFLFVISRL